MLGGGYSFSQVPVADIPRSTFNRSHGHKTTFDSGYLVPFFCDEALPGDTFKVDVSLFARLATPMRPVMDNLHMDVFFFAVPNRLLWSNWQRMMGEQASPGDSIDFLVPEVDAGSTGFEVGSVYDYLGAPTGVPYLKASALFGRAYYLIYHEWFRDQNLIASAKPPTNDGPDSASLYAVRRRGKRHDYFTSALPWPQKEIGVELPLGASAPVVATGDKRPLFIADEGYPSEAPQAGLRIQNTGSPSVVPVEHYINFSGTPGGSQDLAWGDPKLMVDLGEATAATINSLRQAFQIQKLLERDARGGTRYVEILRSHFGVVSPDARLQRPEYLGGGSVPVIFNPVTQTSGTAGTGGYTDTPQGNLAAYAVAGGKGLGFAKSFVEHCVILGLVCVRADLTYQNGLHRMFSRRTRYDFYWPAFSHLGEQTVYNKEIYAQGPSIVNPATSTAYDEEAFGYQERWAEYRYYPSKITGKFRSSDPQSLDIWHLSQEFTALPVLNQTFIEENPPVARIVAVQDEPEFLFDSHINMSCTRPMPTYSVPGLIDHF